MLPDRIAGLELVHRRRAEVSMARRESRRPSFTTHREVVLADAYGRLAFATSTPLPVQERLALHWGNHFSVREGQVVGYLAGDMDRAAIRPHMLGRFRDLLRACTTHPAMLAYLSNDRSIGPNSRAGRNGVNGLNENLARELLELHTLGVDGGYTQDDVLETARILTGWGVDLARTRI